MGLMIFLNLIFPIQYFTVVSKFCEVRRWKNTLSNAKSEALISLRLTLRRYAYEKTIPPPTNTTFTTKLH